MIAPKATVDEECSSFHSYSGACDCPTVGTTKWVQGLLYDNTWKCVKPIENCRVYDGSHTHCLECERVGAYQYGVMENGGCQKCGTGLSI